MHDQHHEFRPCPQEMTAACATGGASKSLRPPYGRSQAQAPAQGDGGGPAGAPDLGGVTAEGSRDQDLPEPSEQPAVPTAAAPAAKPRAVRASAAAAARRKPKRRQRDAALKKKFRITVRFDASERQWLRAEADAAGLSLAHLVARRALVGDGTSVPLGTGPASEALRSEQMDAAIDELAATRGELSAWGNNLNQIARQLNMGAPLPAGPAEAFADTAEHLLAHVRELVTRLDDCAHRLAKRRGRS